jgi:FMN phosphatase YigB (HAD superfamily)
MNPSSPGNPRDQEIRLKCLSGLIVFDGDNTLWDTHALFVSARRELLTVLGKKVTFRQDEDHETTLLAIDRELISATATTEYDFHHFATAAVLCFMEGIHPQEAAQRACRLAAKPPTRIAQIVEQAHRAFTEALHAPPRPYAGAEDLLSLIRSVPQVTMVLFSEGAPSRVSVAMDRLRVRFDQVVIQKKSRHTWRAVKTSGHRLHKSNYGIEPPVSVLVGDSIQRDIKPGNQVGFLTVYCPAEFLGRESPRTPIERPDHTIGSITKLPALLRSLGIPVESTHAVRI